MLPGLFLNDLQEKASRCGEMPFVPDERIAA
jgi:hypothetical protein